MQKLTFGLAALLVLLAGPGFALDNPPINQTIVVDGVERESILYVPATYRAENATPLVLEFHGTGATPESQLELSGLSALAEQHGFLLVAPVAKYPRASDQRLTWNVDLHADAVDDVAFVAALQEENILTVPGSGFGGPGHMRIAYCVSDGAIVNALPGFERVIKRFKK